MVQPFKEFLMETQDKKNPLSVTTSMPQYPTGYMYLDYGTGSYAAVYDENEQPLYVYHNIGIPQGSVNVVISKSQGGKTSLCTAIGSAIIEPYVTRMLYDRMAADARKAAVKPDNLEGLPFIHILDTEKTLPQDYAKKVARYSNRLAEKCIVINPITTDKDLIRALDKHVRYKVSTMKKIPMPMLDMFGRPVIDYPPTVLIIDSTSQLLLEDCDDPSSVKKKDADIVSIYETATQNTAGARRAKIITALYSQLVNYAKKYNIIIFSINHINKMLPVNGIPVKQYRGLRAGETIGGGEKAIYLSANILRLDVIKSVGYETSTSLNLGPDITGHVAVASWIKSKSNSKSNKCQLVYTNKAGYDPLLSNLYFGTVTGDLHKVGMKYALTGHEDLKFTLKDYETVFGDHPEMFNWYYDQLKRDCEKLLDNPEIAAGAEKKLMEDIRDDIHDEYRSGADRGDVMDMDDLFAATVNT